MKDIHARLARAERQACLGEPLFLVTFEDGTKRKMADIDLYLYSVRRSAFMAEPGSCIMPAFIDCRLIRGNITAIPLCIAEEIESKRKYSE